MLKERWIDRHRIKLTGTFRDFVRAPEKRKIEIKQKNRKD